MPVTDVAVVTDAVSAEHFLPLWADYYGRQFGRDNLYVFCYGDSAPMQALGLGHVLPVKASYNNMLRTALVNDLTERLLQRYAQVVRVDVDEFLAPDPRVHVDLAAFVAASRAPYVTALGLDVVELEDETPLDLGQPLLAQRRYAVKAAAYSKTALTRTRLAWGPGFHTTDAPPAFGGLYLFHWKFADAARRLRWLDGMVEASGDDEGHRAHFHAAGREFRKTLQTFRALPRRDDDSALGDPGFADRLVAAARRGDDGQFRYPGAGATDRVLSAIPSAFRGLL